MFGGGEGDEVPWMLIYFFAFPIPSSVVGWSGSAPKLGRAFLIGLDYFRLAGVTAIAVTSDWLK